MLAGNILQPHIAFALDAFCGHAGSTMSGLPHPNGPRHESLMEFTNVITYCTNCN